MAGLAGENDRWKLNEIEPRVGPHVTCVQSNQLQPYVIPKLASCPNALHSAQPLQSPAMPFAVFIYNTGLCENFPSFPPLSDPASSSSPNRLISSLPPLAAYDAHCQSLLRRPLATNTPRSFLILGLNVEC